MEPPALPRVSIILPLPQNESVPEPVLSALQRQSYHADKWEMLPAPYTEGENEFWDERIPPKTPGAAINEAVALATGSILVLLGPACIPAQNWLEALVAPLAAGQAHVAQGIVQMTPTSTASRFAALEQMETLREWSREGARLGIDHNNVAILRERWDRAGPCNTLVRTLDGLDRDLAYRLDIARAKGVLAAGARVVRSSDERFSTLAARHYALAHDVGMLVAAYGVGVLSSNHRPATVKMQTGLVVLWVTNLFLLAVAPPDAWFYANAVFFLVFLVSTTGLCTLALRTDRKLFWFLPVLVLLRAAVTACGFFAGWVRHQLARLHHERP